MIFSYCQCGNPARRLEPIRMNTYMPGNLTSIGNFRLRSNVSRRGPGIIFQQVIDDSLDFFANLDRMNTWLFSQRFRQQDHPILVTFTPAHGYQPRIEVLYPSPADEAVPSDVSRFRRAFSLSTRNQAPQFNTAR